MKVVYSGRNIGNRIITATTFLCIAYAIVRYNVAGNVPWKDVPVFVLNKGISLASLVLLIGSLSLGPLCNLGVRISESILHARKSMGIIGFVYVSIHLLMSMSILNPRYYPKFFASDYTLSLQGSIVILAGILGFTLAGIHHFSFKEGAKRAYPIIVAVKSKKIVVCTMLFFGCHVFFMGFKGWLGIDQWHGGLPPISLLSFSLFLMGFMVNLLGRK
ncbi:hypothetical protein HPE56_03090 [Maribacter sp. ANRC-HE7]|uniref:Sulfoxide reductase heme-binding subunit YedZ n=1 Tax=Maribacter aquimaris TaxID=2737171 RepID=A0ABR7UW90_9FLAO|nr:hypothetical protein [Maribacter aquimaris]MBD0776769.1 hypothetical protein [Maribacter aquimaris]